MAGLIRSDIMYSDLRAASKKINALSIKYYNQSLDFAKEDKLTPAIYYLRKSVAYNKKNVEAQNLLGLLYYRMGRVTNSFINWRTSLAAKPKDNPAQEYLQDMLNSVDFVEKSKAVSKFNESLNHAKHGNYDMAIMRLKRGLDFNSKSVDILNLLAYCYIMQGEESAAYKYVEKVLKIDKANSIALGYQKYLRPDKLTIFGSKGSSDNGNYNKAAANAINRVASNKGNIIYFLLGIGVTAVLSFSLVIPTIFKDYEGTLRQQETDYVILKNQTDESLAQKDETIKALTEENINLTAELYAAGEQDLQERVKLLAEIEDNYKSDNVELAAERLIILDSTGFTGEVLDKYRELCTTVLPVAAEKYFSDGQSEQEKENYDEAIELYNKCIKCTSGGEEMRYSAMYQLAKIALEQGDSATAAKYFTTVAEKHPVETIKNEAAVFLNEYHNS